MITKRHIYEPIERIESAVKRLVELADEAYDSGLPVAAKKIHEIVQRDLSAAQQKLEYVMEIAD